MSKLEQTYVQGGADFNVGGKRTKSALKTAIKEAPGNVYLYDTSAFGSKFNGPATSLEEGMTFNVVGPDPYRDRSWYASVYRNKQGGLTVK